MTKKNAGSKILLTPGWGRPDFEGMSPEEAAELAELEASAPKPLPPFSLGKIDGRLYYRHPAGEATRLWREAGYRRFRKPDGRRRDTLGRLVGRRALALGYRPPKRDLDAFLRRYDRILSGGDWEAKKRSRLCPVCWQRLILLIDRTIPPHPDPRPRLKRLAQECAGSGLGPGAKRRP